MSLIAWYTLSDNKNKCDSETLRTGGSFNGIGKVTNNVLTFTGGAAWPSTYAINQTTKYNLTGNFSFALWLKHEGQQNTDAADYAFTVGRADTGGFGYGVQIVGDNLIYIWYGNGTCAVTVKKNEWHHICCAIKNNTVNIYIDGQYTNKFTPTELPTYYDGDGIGLGCFRMSGGNLYGLHGLINDFRIYDHCLSVKEIKELAKGLCLHYTFDDVGNNNILTLDQACRYETSDAYGFASTQVDLSKITLGQTYTLSVNGRTNYGTNRTKWLSIYIYDASWSTFIENFYITESTDTTKSITFNMPEALAGKAVYITAYYFPSTATDNGSATVNWYKLEKGNSSTDFYNTDKIIDNSGYGNNGIFVNKNNFSLTTDTNIGNRSLCCTDCGNTSRIETSLKPSFITNGTICFWYKKDTAALNFNNGCFLAATERNGTWLAATATDSSAPFNNGCSYSKWYIDGVESKSSYITDTNWHFYCYTGVNLSKWTEFNIHKHGDSNWCFRGNISDYKIFATALTQNDILDLYKNRGSIGKNNIIFVDNIIEDNEYTAPPKISKKGILFCKDIYETDKDLPVQFKQNSVSCVGINSISAPQTQMLIQIIINQGVNDIELTYTTIEDKTVTLTYTQNATIYAKYNTYYEWEATAKTAYVMDESYGDGQTTRPIIISPTAEEEETTTTIE